MLMIGTDRQRVLQTIDYRADLCVDIILSLDVIAIPSHTGQVEVYISSPRTLVRVLVMHFFFHNNSNDKYKLRVRSPVSNAFKRSSALFSTAIDSALVS